MHTPLNMEGSHHHSSDVYMHAAHSHASSDTSFHMTSLDSKEPILRSVNFAYCDLITAKIQDAIKIATLTSFLRLPQRHDFLTTVLQVSMHGPR